MSLEPAKLPVTTVLADVHYQDEVAAAQLGEAMFEQYRRDATGADYLPVFLMVGATSSTGDSLGPFVGWFLKRKGCTGTVVGDLNGPVHATNMEEKVREMRMEALRTGCIPYIIAVDAAVGRSGHITVNRGPLKPGAGMGKSLPAIGNMHVMGGTASFPFLIWFTGLDQTVAMAEVIADGILTFYERLSRSSARC